MNGIELTRAILHLKPNSEFVIHNEDYSTITWIVLDGQAPTLQELENANGEIKELAAREETAKETARAIAEAKLAALGLTADDLKALGL